jgi:hypothetical protein
LLWLFVPVAVGLSFWLWADWWAYYDTGNGYQPAFRLSAPEQVIVSSVVAGVVSLCLFGLHYCLFKLQFSILALLIAVAIVAVDLTVLRLLYSYNLLSGGVLQITNLGACLLTVILQFGWLMIAKRSDAKRRWWIGFQIFGLSWILIAILAAWQFGSFIDDQVWNLYESGFLGPRTLATSRTLQTVYGLTVFLAVPVVGVTLGIVGGGILANRVQAISSG